MTDTIMIHPKGTTAYEMLEKAAMILTATSKHGITYKVENTYFDYGQGWAWTTIVAYKTDAVFGSYQALNPRDHEKIIESDDLIATITEIKADKFWNDK